MKQLNPLTIKFSDAHVLLYQIYLLQTNYPLHTHKLYIKLFTYTVRNNMIRLELSYHKPQDCYVTLKYKNHLNGYKPTLISK